MKYVIDRIEGETAVCEREDGGIEQIPLKRLCAGIKEGDHFRFTKEGECRVSPEETAQARRKNLLLQNMLFEEE